MQAVYCKNSFPKKLTKAGRDREVFNSFVPSVKGHGKGRLWVLRSSSMIDVDRTFLVSTLLLSAHQTTIRTINGRSHGNTESFSVRTLP